MNKAINAAVRASVTTGPHKKAWILQRRLLPREGKGFPKGDKQRKLEEFLKCSLRLCLKPACFLHLLHQIKMTRSCICLTRIMSSPEADGSQERHRSLRRHRRHSLYQDFTQYVGLHPGVATKTSKQKNNGFKCLQQRPSKIYGYWTYSSWTYCKTTSHCSLLCVGEVL